MKGRLGKIVIVLLIIGLVYYAYVRWQRARAVNTGEIQLLQDGTEVPTRTDIDISHTTTDTKQAAAVTVTHTPTPAPQAAVPTTDSIPANPPNGMVFSGTGRYQLYRQGSITWRLDTDNGHTCIIFATDEEWRKERVYSHGCAND